MAIAVLIVNPPGLAASAIHSERVLSALERACCLRCMKLRRGVRMVEDCVDDITGVDAAKVRGGNKRPSGLPAEIDLKRCRVAAGVLLKRRG